jgi:hypothetical protein
LKKDDDLVAWLNALDDQQRRTLARHLDMTQDESGDDETRTNLIEAALAMLKSDPVGNPPRVN